MSTRNKLSIGYQKIRVAQDASHLLGKAAFKLRHGIGEYVPVRGFEYIQERHVPEYTIPMLDDIIASVQKMYDESGAYWHATRSKKYRTTGTANWPVLQKYVDTLKPGDSILDVGCGNGRLASGLPPSVTYLGIDFSRALLAEAKKAHPTLEFRYANIVEDRAWADLATYDALFCVAVLHHIPTREQQVYILTQMKKVCKKGGFLFLSVWNLWQERFLQNHLDSMELKRVNERYVEVPFAGEWKRFCFSMDIPYLLEIMKEAGWDVEEIFFADRDGAKADIQTGLNLVVVAH